jgi:hypothetical protein
MRKIYVNLWIGQPEHTYDEMQAVLLGKRLTGLKQPNGNLSLGQRQHYQKTILPQIA